MEAVSNAGNGICGLITDEDQATRYVNQRLLSTMTHIAKDMKIQVEFNPKFVYAYRLIGFDNRLLADSEFRDDVVDAGEVGAGHRVTAFYELVLDKADLPQLAGTPTPAQGDAFDGDVEVAPNDLALVKVRYKSIDATETEAAKEVKRAIAPEQLSDSVGSLDGDFQWAAAIATFAEILRGSPFADPSVLDKVEAIVLADEHAGDPDRAEFALHFPIAKVLLE